MEDQTNLIESLYEKTKDYGKTSIELIKLKAIDKSSDLISSLLPGIIIFIFITLFFLIFNIGLAIWIGQLLGNVCYGFFIIAAFYGLAGIIFHLFFRKRLKRCMSDLIIKLLLK